MSARRWAAESASTLKPTTIAFEAVASMISFLPILPVSACNTFMEISPRARSAKEDLIGSREPCTSAFMINRSSRTSPAWNFSNNCSKVTAFVGFSASALWMFLRSLVIARACLSDLTTWNKSPATGTSLRPITAIGAEGSATSTWLPKWSNIARKRPWVVPTTTIFPTFRVPFWINRVAKTPLERSFLASITVPMTRPFGLAWISELSATSNMASRRSSKPSWRLAEMGTTIVSPSHSSGTRPISASC